MIYWMKEEYHYVVIQEEHRVYKLMHMTCKKLLDDLCHLYGTTYEGRREAICRSLDITKQVPILISFDIPFVCFPLANGNKGIWWFNYNGIEDAYKVDEAHTKLVFLQGKELLVEVSYRSVQRQMQRCKMFLKILHTYALQEYLDMLYQTQGIAYES